MKKELKTLLTRQNELNVQMEKQLIEILKEHGNLIRTDQTEHKDTILGFIFDEEIDRYIDKKVLAITVIGNQLCVLLGELDAELDEDITDEELLAISDDWDWEPITAGMMLVSDTFVNICERISQYV